MEIELFSRDYKVSFYSLISVARTTFLLILMPIFLKHLRYMQIFQAKIKLNSAQK